MKHQWRRTPSTQDRGQTTACIILYLGYSTVTHRKLPGMRCSPQVLVPSFNGFDHWAFGCKFGSWAHSKLRTLSRVLDTTVQYCARVETTMCCTEVSGAKTFMVHAKNLNRNDSEDSSRDATGKDDGTHSHPVRLAYGA